MPNEISAAELLAFYKSIESGAVRLVAEADPQDVYAGNVVYQASNGWRLTVFNDANEFDYVDEVRSADGRVTDFDSIDGTEADWQPSDEVAWKCLGIPGYCKFRCTVCGVKLSFPSPRRGSVTPPFLCGGKDCAGRGSPPVGTWVRSVQNPES